jgi:amino acid transporter
VAQNADTAHRLGGGTKLSLLDAIAQSIGFMGPVFSIAFLVPLLVGITSATQNGAGAAAPLSVLLAALGVLGLGWIVSEYARRISAAGSLYDYISDGFGTRIGAAFGFLYYVGVIGLGGALLIMLGGTIHDTLDAEFGRPILPEALWDLVLLALAGAVLYLGVALSTRTQLVLAMVSIAVVMLFALYVIVKVGSGNDVAKAFSPATPTNGLTGVMFGVLYGVLLFTGFETAANLGEETSHPKRDIPRAVLTSVIAVAGFYVIVAYAQVAGFGFNTEAIGKNAGAPLFALASGGEGGFGSDTVRHLIELVVVLDMLAVLIGCSVAGSRGVFALARDARLPRALATISARSTPLTASALVAALYALMIAVTLWVPSFLKLPVPPGTPDLPHYVSMFSWFAALGGLALAVIYLVMSIGAIRGLSDHPQPWKVYLACGVGILVTAAAIFGSWYQVPAPTSYAVWTALAVLIGGFLLTMVFPGRPDAGPDHFTGLAPSEQGPMKL